MKSCTDEIKSILQNVFFLKVMIKNGTISETLNRKLAFIEACVSALDEESRFLIKAVYYDEVQITKLAKSHYCNRVTIYKKINGIIKKIEKVFTEQSFI